jgi:hypothetical protein
MLRGDTFSIPKNAPLPTHTPYPADAVINLSLNQSSLDKIKAMEQAVVSLKKYAHPSYASYLDQVLAQIRVAKNAGMEFADGNYRVLQTNHMQMLQQIADEAVASKQSSGAQYPKIPSLPQPSFPMPSDPSVVFDQPSVKLPTVSISDTPDDRVFGTVSQPDLTARTPSFFTSSGLMDLVNVFTKGWSDKQKIDAHSKLLTAQMSGKPLVVNPLVAQQVQQKEANRFPWQWVIIGGIALGAVVVLATLPSRKQPDLTKTPVSA